MYRVTRKVANLTVKTKGPTLVSAISKVLTKAMHTRASTAYEDHTHKINPDSVPVGDFIDHIFSVTHIREGITLVGP